jgi:N-acetylmuramoyl-L-alanine amidase
VKIEAVPSPNFNDRKHPVDMLVLHYTGMESGQAALDRMTDATAEVSAHYMVWEDGNIAQMVGEDKRAWHAGVSSWQGDGDLNSRSIGIEIVNGGHDWPLEDGKLQPFPKVQIAAVIELCQGVLSRWDIPVSRIVGHSDIAPDRKDDPGEHFPWRRLAAAGVGFVPEETRSDALNLMGRGLGASDKGAAVMRLQKSLVAIGYGLEATGAYDALTQKTVTAFQRRWVQDRVSGDTDLLTLAMITAVEAAYTSSPAASGV